MDQEWAGALAEAGFAPEHLDQLSMPHMISVRQEYLEEPLRILFVGKETNGGYGKLRSYYEQKVDVPNLLGRYDRFMDSPGKGAAFFRMHRKAGEQLAGGRHQAVLWANLMKMDWNQGRTDSRKSLNHSRQLRELSARMLRFEVEVLKPHVIMFACGAEYDSAIKAAFPEYRTRQVATPRALWYFDIGDIVCCRLRHPQATRGRKKRFERTQVYYDRAFTHIKNCFPQVYGASTAPASGQARALQGKDSRTACGQPVA